MVLHEGVDGLLALRAAARHVRHRRPQPEGRARFITATSAFADGASGQEVGVVDLAKAAIMPRGFAVP
jgi:hypothetical protein